MTTTRRNSLAQRMDAGAGRSDTLTALAEKVCTAVAVDVPFAFGCFATTDPATGLINWAHKTHPLAVGDEEFAATEYGPPDVNRFVDLARRDLPVGILSVDTGGHPELSRRFREFLAPRFGFTDELRVVFRSHAASWGALALYRGVGDPPFSPAEGRSIASVAEAVAAAIRGTLFAADPPTGSAAYAPAVLIVDAVDRVVTLTPAARVAVDELGGWENGSLPTSLLAVVAAARSEPTLAGTRAQTRSGRWVNLRAAPLHGRAGSPDVVVTVDPVPRADLSRLALVARDLTAREQDVAVLVLQGADTRTIATTLHVSPHTVQDHLKTVFSKLGVNSRREMVARLVLG